MLLAAAFLAACRGDSDGLSEPNQKGMLQITTSRKDFQQIESPATRALPAGYHIIDEPENGASLQLFLTTGADTYEQGTFTYFRRDEKWYSNLVIPNGTQCGIYGYMPSIGQNNIAPNHGSFGNGAILTLTDLPPLAITDLCVITGVLQGSSPFSPITASNIREGKFDYKTMPAEDGNYLYLLLDHIYASLDFKFRVDASYLALRKIKLKEVILQTEAANAVTAVIKMKANSTGLTPIESVEWTKTAIGHGEQTFYLNEEGQWLTTEYTSLADAQFAPIFTDANDLVLKCRYDVYTAKGDLIRKDETAENHLSYVLGMAPGQKRTIMISINPTYLYVLADPDMVNNPGEDFVIE
jgi:hypothetical protein